MPLAFGIAHRAPSAKTDATFAKFLARLSEAAGFQITPDYSETYEELTAKLAQGDISLAWLPPIPFIFLERTKLAVPLVGHHRSGSAQFESVLITRADAKVRTLAGLTGKRVAWVDALSASGYVLPRIQLAALGVDPRTAFSGEQFLGSHEAVVRAVLEKHADVAATHARSWESIAGAEKEIRVFMSFGELPADVTAARKAMHEAVREALRTALVGMTETPEGAALAREVFGVDEMRPWIAATYDPLRRALADAAERGLLDAIRTLEVRSI